jgi:HD-GYP domain-containing protein (c-di-GMP phosphodiesterase class II)
MRLVSIANCVPGYVLAKPIYHSDGKLLLGIGVELSERIIRRLEFQGIPFLYIRDEATDDIDLGDDIPIEVRREATETIYQLFFQIKQGDHKWSAAIHRQKMVDEIKKVFTLLLSEIKNRKRVMNLLTTVQVKDHYLFAHSINVTLYTLAVAVHRHFSDKMLYEIGIGTLLHDIGKMLIPEEILKKPGKLTEEEFDIVKKHTEYGFDILRKEYEIPLLSAHCALQHHEKWDGTGYPRGLKGEEIHTYARTISVCDVFDALTSNRVYKEAILPHEAIEIIYGQTNSYFEAPVVEAFREVIAIYPIGVTVKLNSGETAVVIDNNSHLPSRPVLRVIKDPSGKSLKTYYEVDLSKQLTLMITECDAIL